MDEYRKKTYTDYQPNFVMKDPEPAAADKNDRQETTMRQPHENHNNADYTSSGYHYRDDFAKDNASKFRSTDNGRFENTAGNRFENTADDEFESTMDDRFEYTRRNKFKNTAEDPSANTNSNANAGSASFGASASWDIANGYRPSRKSKRAKKKPSSPVMLTKKSFALLIVMCVVISGVFGVGGAALGNHLFDDDPSSPSNSGSISPTGYTLEDATGSNMTVQQITEKAKASVVEIKTESVASDSWMQQYVTEGAGSGVIVTNDGYIVTNNHVIEGANKITVTTANEKEYKATLIGTDPTTDVAVLKIDAKNLTAATYGNSDQLAVGDLAVAIGNPLGELGGTVTAGIISALDRQLSIDGKTMTLLQTDSSINPGNSGGGLFNSDGQLIGIVVAKSSGSDVEGLGFAIPINTAANVAQQIMDKGYVSGQPSTGMTYVEGNGQQRGSDLDFLFGNDATSSNVYVYSVDSDNAKKAGFEEGDMIYAVDGKEITCFDDLSSIVTAHKIGDKLKFTVIRNGEEKKLTLKLEEKTAEKQTS